MLIIRHVYDKIFLSVNCTAIRCVPGKEIVMAEEKKRRTEDRRVKRTKRILRECLFRLLEQKPLKEITVKELTEAADVNRSTFYFYYRDINDMMMQIQREIYTVFEAEVIASDSDFNTVEDFTGYIVRFLLFCKENETICKFVVGNDPDNHLTSLIRASLLEHIPDSKTVFPPDDPKCYLTCIAMTGVWETIIQWMYDGMQVPPDELAAFLSNVYFYGGRTVLLGDVE